MRGVCATGDRLPFTALRDPPRGAGEPWGRSASQRGAGPHPGCCTPHLSPAWSPAPTAPPGVWESPKDVPYSSNRIRSLGAPG